MKSPTVMAGLKCPPEMWPTAKAMARHSKAEGERYARESNPQFGKACRQHSAAASAKDEHKRAEKLGA